VLAGLFSACTPPDRESRSTGATLMDVAHGPVQVKVALHPRKVDFSGDVFLTLTVTARPGIDVEMPSLHDRVRGLVVKGAFDETPAPDGDGQRWVRHLRLMPMLSDEYGLLPVPVVYTDRRVRPAHQEWFATPQVLFKSASTAQTDIEAAVTPVRIPPSLRAIIAWTLCLGLVLTAGAVAVRRSRREVVTAQPPGQYAEQALARLLAEHLPSRGLTREFYAELTMIARRYVERRYAIRAPELTTEEFLSALAEDPRFSAEEIRRLRAFLQAADLVKFAAVQPLGRAIRQAVESARAFWKEG